MTKKATENLITLETLMLGYLCVRDIEEVKEKVTTLDRFDLPDAAISQIVGKNVQAVRDARRSPKKQR